jgi:hypothetical protein
MRERLDQIETIIEQTAQNIEAIAIAVPIQMRYNIRSQDVGARHCRAPTGVPHLNKNRYIFARQENDK